MTDKQPYDPEWYNKIREKDDRRTIKIWIAVIILAVIFGVWWEVYRYLDCRKVGHTVVYCLLSK